eukprot:1452430-Rhodomonas_salina.1
MSLSRCPCAPTGKPWKTNACSVCGAHVRASARAGTENGSGGGGQVERPRRQIRLGHLPAWRRVHFRPGIS